MLKAKFQRLLGLLLLAVLIAWYRQGHGHIYDYVIATLAIVAFWLLHSIQFSISNIRMLILITCLFAVPLFFADRLPFFSWHEGLSGPWTGESFNPSQVGMIELSHEIATQIYFDHEPKGDERYTKTGAFAYTQDGLRYEMKKEALDEKVVPLAKNWTHENLEGRSLTDKELAIEHFLQKDFQYSLAPGTLNSSHPLDEFLFERKRGYCQHFAGAVAALFKLSGTPARVVVGFSGGTWNPILNTLTYEMADSHAWVEVYDSSTKTWATVDPTYWVLQAAPVDLGVKFDLVLKSLALLLLAVGLVLLVLARERDPLRIIFARVEKFEKRRGWPAVGLTLQERLLRMAEAQPKRAPQITEMLLAYQEAYFRGEPTRERVLSLKNIVCK